MGQLLSDWTFFAGPQRSKWAQKPQF